MILYSSVSSYSYFCIYWLFLWQMPKWEMWKKDYRGLIAKFIIFVFVNMRLIFVLLPQVNVKGWTLWNWARGNLANEFLYGGTCPIEIDGKTCSTICRKFYCNKKTFSKMMNTCFTFYKKWKYCKKKIEIEIRKGPTTSFLRLLCPCRPCLLSCLF